MNMKTKRILRSSEVYVIAITILFCLFVQLRSGQFFTGNNLVDLVRAMIIPTMFCMGELMVLISGGTDVSFPAIASLAMFVSCTTLEDVTQNIFVYFAVAILIGLLFGAFNGFIIAKFQFPALIVTLGTSSICFGIMQGPFASREYPLTQVLLDLGKSKLFTATGDTGLTSDMPVTIIFCIALVAISWFILNKTMLGRGIYAIGGDRNAAKRSGFNIFAINMFIYSFSGAMAGLVGVLRAVMLQAVQPNNLQGMEMTVIAACVLGGVSITGGKGTVLQSVVGMLLLTVVSSSLILIGIPAAWSGVFTGAIIIIGTAVTALEYKRSKNRLTVKVDNG